MEKEIENIEKTRQDFLFNSKIVENYNFLEEIGILSFIDGLTKEINNYKTLLTKGLEIFNHTTINDILDSTVKQISDHFLPSFISFIWKPIQNRSDITIRSYNNYKQVELDIKINNITAFETFFQQFPQPINFHVLKKDLKNDKALEPFKKVLPEIIIPILGPFGLYGIILVGRKILEAGYNNEELAFLQHLMSFVSQAIKNHLHYEHSLHDVKTGLYNHGFFMTRFGEEVIRSKRVSGASSLIVIDVDNFKKFNDSFGHLAGDKVLEKLAQVIRSNVRTVDIPSRFGGEEFTILLPNTDINIAWLVAERLRKNVSLMQVTWDVPLPQVTISLGLFSFDQNNNLEMTEILRRADEALYVSKARGRNCSTIWEPDIAGIKG